MTLAGESSSSGNNHEMRIYISDGGASARPFLTNSRVYGALADIEMRTLDSKQEKKDEENDIWQKIYQKKLEDLLCNVPKKAMPLWMHGPAVDEPQSYNVEMQRMPRKVWSTDTSCVPHVALSKVPDMKHQFTVPLHDSLDQGNVRVIIVQSRTEAEGIMRYKLAGTTTFVDEEQRMRANRIFLYSNYLLLASLLATPPYVMYRDYNTGLSNKDVLLDIVWNIFVNLVTVVPINTVIDCVYLAPKKREGQRMLYQYVSEWPTEHEVDPTVIAIVHEYAARELLQTMRTLQRRQGKCRWLCCLPVWDLFMRCLGVAYKDVDISESIETLLNGSYLRLEKKLEDNGHLTPRIEAAQRIAGVYQQILNRTNELQLDKIDTIVTRSGFDLDLTHRQRVALTQCIQNVRVNLVACVPPNIGPYMVQEAES